MSTLQFQTRIVVVLSLVAGSARAENYPQVFKDAAGVDHRIEYKSGALIFGHAEYIESFKSHEHLYTVTYSSEERLRDRRFDRIETQEQGKKLRYVRDPNSTQDVVREYEDEPGHWVRELAIYRRQHEPGENHTQLQNFLALVEQSKVHSWPGIFPLFAGNSTSHRSGGASALRARDIQEAFYEAATSGALKSLRFLAENERPGKDQGWILPLDKRPLLEPNGYRLNVDAHPYSGVQIPYPPYDVGTPLLDALEAPEASTMPNESTRFAIAKYLLENGANVNALSSSGNTALHLIVTGAFGTQKSAQFESTRMDFVKLLFEHGYDLKLRGSDALWKPALVEVIESCALDRGTQEELANELLDQGADPYEEGFMHVSALKARPCQSRPASQQLNVARLFFSRTSKHASEHARLMKADPMERNLAGEKVTVRMQTPQEVVPVPHTVTIQLPKGID
jgi:hypothetical protein